MMRYSRTKIVILIIIFAVLWISTCVNEKLPYADETEVRIDVQSDSVMITSSMENVLRIMSAEGDEIRIESGGDEKSISGTTYKVDNPSDAVIFIPSSYTDISVNAIDRIEVTSLEGSSLSISNINGGIGIADVKAEDLSVTSVSGDISISGISCDGLLEIRNTSGDIFIHDNSLHDIDIESTSGDILFGNTDGHECMTDLKNGDISAEGLNLSSFTADVLNGSISLTSVSAPYIKLSNMNGDVTLSLEDAQEYTKVINSVKSEGDLSKRMEIEARNGDVIFL